MYNIHFKINECALLLKISDYKRYIIIDFTWLLWLLEDREFKNRYPFIAQYYSPNNRRQLNGWHCQEVATF